MFVLDPEALADAAVRIAEAAEALTCLDVAGPVAAARVGLPGTATSRSCLWLSSRLDAAIEVWAERLLDTADAARAAARDAVATDRDVADDHLRLVPWVR